MSSESVRELRVTEETFREKFRRVVVGLNAPPDSGEYKYAMNAMQRVFAPSSASTAVTVLVLVALLFLVHTVREESVLRLDTELKELETVELDKLEDEPPEVEKEFEELVSLEPSSETTDHDAVDISRETVSYGDDSSDDTVRLPAIAFNNSVLVMKDLLGGLEKGGRAWHRSRMGDGVGNITPVLKALRWLKANQNEDGSWTGSGSYTAMTGLALLCYMAHGETPASEEFGETVEKAIRYLLYAQDGAGRFKNCGNHYVYGHAIATYALAESWGMTRMVMLKEPVEKAVQVIIDGQQAGGAWDYEFAKAVRKDLSVSSWQVQALKAAKLAGAENERLDECMETAVDGTKSFGTGGGYLSYTGEGQSPTLTAAGVLCMQLLGRPDDAAVRAGLAAIENLQCEWGAGGQVAHNNTYSWYYGTQAKYQYGGGLWEKWNRQVFPTLVENQLPDGHWEQGGTHEASPVYDTTLCCLCLEVPYKYLPTYAELARSKSATVSLKDSGDLIVEVAPVL